MGLLPNCKDPSLAALKSVGYNVVRLPRVDLLPTQLLVAQGDRLHRLGELRTVFVANPEVTDVPPISADQPGPNISGTKSADVDIGTGLNILGGLISALGGSTLGLSLSYSRARSIQFEFTDTIENHTETAALDVFLASSKIHEYAVSARQMLDSDRVYVVTATLKSRSINVVAKDEHKNALAIDVPTIQNAIGGNLKVDNSGASSTTLTYQGAIPLVFGFQAIRLDFDQGRYRAFKLVEAGTVGSEANESLDIDAMLLGDL